MYRFHHLKLYPLEQNGPQSTKKPVVMETYDEVVFPDPSEQFLARVQNHPAVVVPRLPAGLELPSSGMMWFFFRLCFYRGFTFCELDLSVYFNDIASTEERRGSMKDHPLGHWFMNFSEADELLKLAAARQQVVAII